MDQIYIITSIWTCEPLPRNDNNLFLHSPWWICSNRIRPRLLISGRCLFLPAPCWASHNLHRQTRKVPFSATYIFVRSISTSYKRKVRRMAFWYEAMKKSMLVLTDISHASVDLPFLFPGTELWRSLVLQVWHQCQIGPWFTEGVLHSIVPGHWQGNSIVPNNKQVKWCAKHEQATCTTNLKCSDILIL